MKLVYDEENITSIDVQGETEDLSLIRDLVDRLDFTVEDTETGFIIKGFKDHSEGKQALKNIVKSVWLFSQLAKLNEVAESKTIEELIKEI